MYNGAFKSSTSQGRFDTIALGVMVNGIIRIREMPLTYSTSKHTPGWYVQSKKFLLLFEKCLKK